MAKGYNLEQTGPQVQEAINKSLNLTTATQSKEGLMSAQDKQKLDSLDSELAGKVDKVPGKGLSTNDYDNTEKGKVASAYQKPVGGIPASDLAEGVIPDTSQFITKTVNDLANYYLKTETYSRSETYNKTEVDALIALIKQFTYQVVSELPEASESTMYKLYLVPSADPQTQNVKDEYITVRSGSEGAYTYAWEQIGSTAIDLSGYVTTQALNAALANYTTTANLTTLLAAKQDVIADLSTIRSGAAAGATAYQKPGTGIPKTDLESGVQQSLDLADSAIQAEPTGVDVPVEPSLYATKEEVDELEAKVTDITPLTIPSASIDGKYINVNGELVTSASYEIYEISVVPGDEFYIHQWVGSTVVVFSANGVSPYYRVLKRPIDTSVRTYQYICDYTGTLYISAMKGDHTIWGFHNSSLAKALVPDYEEITATGEKSTSHQYIKYADGTINATGSLIDTLTFKNFGYDKIRVFATAFDGIGAAIAFYSSETIDSNYYLKSASVQFIANYGGGSWFEAEVPSNAKLIVVTNHFKYCPVPQVLIRNLSALCHSNHKAIEELRPIVEKHDIQTSATLNPLRFNKHFAHLFLDKVAQDATNIIIPSQSLFDIQVSKRLGFNVIEANVQRTSDNKAIVIHGVQGKFGYEVVDLDGNFTYADTAINSVTLDWIKTNIRYRSDIPKYRVAPPSLEEFLYECKRNDMIPFVHYDALFKDVIDGIMGEDNYIAYNGTRALTSAMISTAPGGLTDKNDILAVCESYGRPYTFCMMNVSGLTVEQLRDITDLLHKNGYFISSAYLDYNNYRKVMDAGFDIYAAQFEVNDFEDANICTLSADLNFNDYTHGGTVDSDGVLNLPRNSTIAPSETMPTVQLGKGVVKICFEGELLVYLGGRAVDSISSDDMNKSITLSTYYLNENATFSLKAWGAVGSVTKIKSISFKASKC